MHDWQFMDRLVQCIFFGVHEWCAAMDAIANVRAIFSVSECVLINVHYHSEFVCPL